MERFKRTFNIADDSKDNVIKLAEPEDSELAEAYFARNKEHPHSHRTDWTEAGDFPGTVLHPHGFNDTHIELN